MCWQVTSHKHKYDQCFKIKCFVCHKQVGLVCATTDVTIEEIEQVICMECNYFYEQRVFELAMIRVELLEQSELLEPEEG